MIDPLLNHTIRHQVDMTSYGNFVLAKMIRILNLTDADLMTQITAALADVDADSFKVHRLDKLLASAREVNAQAYAAFYGGMTEELKAYVQYEGQFQYDLYKSVAPVTFGIAAIVPAQVYAAAVAQPMQGRLLKDWAAGMSDSRLRRIKDTIAVGYTQGKTTADIVREIRGTKAAQYTDGLLNTSRNEIDAVVRTTLSHTAQVTRTRFYEANDDILGDVVWISTLDGKTSEECRLRDHKHYDHKTHEPIGHKIPWRSGPGRLHWRCRSTSVALLKGQQALFGTRSAAGGPVDANLQYNDWLKQQSPETQDDVLGKAKGARYRKDGMRDAAFVNDKGRSITLKEMAERDARAFEQPIGNPTIYDSRYPRVQPDISTPARAAAVKYEEGIRRNKFESGAFFAGDGSLIVSKVGDTGVVTFLPSELVGTRGSLFTHNHPGGTSFSPADVIHASELQLSEVRVVARHYRHTMSASDGWPTPGVIQSTFIRELVQAYEDVDKMIAARKLTAAFSDTEAHHRAWVLVANKLGLTYAREAS
ncbi:MAG: hypothetical protein V4724_26625 [Pseudomonadota bacterium]